MQKLIISGNVGKDAVLRTTQGGEHVLGFSVAVDNGKDASGNKRDSTWFDCSVWGKRATALEGYIRKGTKLTLCGRPTARAHNEKAYLGISVDDLTFMGGGEARGQSQQSNGYASGGSPIDDDIPFAPVALI